MALFALLSLTSLVRAQDVDRARFEAVITWCRTKPDQFVLSDDRSIFCFDGKVMRVPDTLQALDEGSLFVVRSGGGSMNEAVGRPDSAR